MNVNLQSALDGLISAGKAIAGDSAAAMKAVGEFAERLKPDAQQILDAAAVTLASGGDASTWLESLKAQVDAVALETVFQVHELAASESERIKGAALGALHAVLFAALI